MNKKPSRRGTLIIDRIFRGVGRIKRASGTHKRATWKRLNEMLTSLYEAGRLDVLEEIRDGHVGLMQVFRHYRGGRWDDIPTTQHLQPIDPTLVDWAKTYPCSEKHRESLKRSFQSIVNVARAEAKVNDLPQALVTFRKRCQELDHARTFNLARSAVQAYLRSTVGRQDRLWLAVATIQPLPAVQKFHKNPKTVQEAHEIAQRLGPKAGAMWWTLCTTGMGPKEYFEDGWGVEQDRIVIRGRKRKGRHRVVPRFATPVRPTKLTRWGFRQALRRLDTPVTPYDARRTYANWLEEAGIPRTRRMIYLGHGARDVTDLYERHEVAAYLGEDAGKLTKLIAGAGVKLQVMK